MKLEKRYVVMKLKDVDQLPAEDYHQLGLILNKIAAIRAARGKDDLSCLVIEKDWPEFEPAFKLIEGRVDGQEIV